MKDDLPDSNGASAFKRFCQLLGLARSPETAEGLEQEIQELLAEGEEQGVISRYEGKMISSIFEFRDTLAHEIMTPNTEIVSAGADSTIQQMIDLVITEGFSRIPIYASSPDDIIGILHAKDLLPYSKTSAPPPVRDIVKPACFVSENQKIVTLLREFQAKKNHMAIVTDEFGSVRGLITLEDILEEIVGEISDEYDKPETFRRVIDENTLLTDAKLNLEEIESFFKIKLPEGPYESVGGLIIHQLGHLPEKGESLTLNTLTLQVLSATKRRVVTVKIIRHA